MQCREAFDGADEPSARCPRIAQAKPNCGCEAESLSPLSLGLVTDDESVARLIYSPLHIDPHTGEVVEAAFSDVQDKGLSVQRQAHASPEAIRAIGNKKLAADHARGKTDREFLGIVAARVAEVRHLAHDDGSRACCIYDSALPDLPAHADICQTPASRSGMKRVRKRLRDLFGRIPRMP